MFEILYRRAQTIAAQRAAPFAEARQSYVEHLGEQGYARATIRAIARDILGVVERLKLVPPAKATIPEVEAAVEQWMQAGQRSSPATRTRIVNTAPSWLRFSGLFTETEPLRPFAEQIDGFTR